MSGPLRLGHVVVILVTAMLVTLVPLAHASPPDPIWIAGLYHDADHDDAVLAITDGLGYPANDGPANATAGSSSRPIASVDPTWPRERSRISFVDRAPPLT